MLPWQEILFKLAVTLATIAILAGVTGFTCIGKESPALRRVRGAVIFLLLAALFSACGGMLGFMWARA